MTLDDADFRKSRMKVIYRKLSKTASLSVTCLSLHIDTPASTRLKSTFATRDSLNKWRFAKYCPTCLSPFRDGHHTAGPMAPPTSGHQPRRHVDMPHPRSRRIRTRTGVGSRIPASLIITIESPMVRTDGVCGRYSPVALNTYLTNSTKCSAS